MLFRHCAFTRSILRSCAIWAFTRGADQSCVSGVASFVVDCVTHSVQVMSFDHMFSFFHLNPLVVRVIVPLPLWTLFSILLSCILSLSSFFPSQSLSVLARLRFSLCFDIFLSLCSLSLSHTHMFLGLLVFVAFPFKSGFGLVYHLLPFADYCMHSYNTAPVLFTVLSGLPPSCFRLLNTWLHFPVPYVPLFCNSISSPFLYRPTPSAQHIT